MAFVKDLRRDFERLVSRSRLAHGYLLFGQSLTRQRDIVLGFARFLETGSWEGNETLLDLLVLDAASEQGGGIDKIRLFRAEVFVKPFRASRRVILIDAAHQLTQIAQQALLKILEEPPEHAIIFLNVYDPDSLFPPVISRLQRIYVSGEAIFQDAHSFRPEVPIFLRADFKERKAMLKLFTEEERPLTDFVVALVEHLRLDLTRHLPTLSALSYRLMQMHRYNTNQRLQIEAAVLYV